MQRPVPFGKYLLLERISVGGMAEVFKARAADAKESVQAIAIKRILPHLAEDTRFVDMFIDEARMSVQLDHENVIQVIELGRHEDDYFIAMEYIPGRDLLSLHHHLRKTKQYLPIQLAAHIACRVAAGLDYAHKLCGPDGEPLGIIHRDISPQNVIVSYDGAVKLIDFGIAKARVRNYEATQAGVLKGKFGYMSPEQVLSQPIDHRSDIFALGTVLHELLTSERLFYGEHDFATLDMVRGAVINPPSGINPAVPRALDAIVLKALARDLDDRYPTAAAMSADLHDFLEGINYNASAKPLASWMHREFAPRIRKEREKNEMLARYSLSPTGEVIEGDTEENATTGLWDPILDDTLDEAPWAEPLKPEVPVTPVPVPRPAPDLPDAFIANVTPLTSARPSPKGKKRHRTPIWIPATLFVTAIGLAVFIQTMILTPLPPDLTGTGLVLRVVPRENLTIYLNGRVMADRSPVIQRGLAPNRYTIRVDRPGYASWTHTVDVTLGKLKAVDVELTKKTAEPAQIRFVTDPVDAKMTVDNRPVSLAERQRYLTLKGGESVDLMITREGYRTQTVRFTPEPGAKRTERYALDPISGAE